MTNNSIKLWLLPHHSEGWEWSVGSRERWLSWGRSVTHALSMFHCPRAVPLRPVNLLYACTSFNLGFGIVNPPGIWLALWWASALPSAGDCQHPPDCQVTEELLSFHPDLKHEWAQLRLASAHKSLPAFGRQSQCKESEAGFRPPSRTWTSSKAEATPAPATFS